MKRKNIINFVLLIALGIPLAIFRRYQYGYQDIQTIHLVLFSILGFLSALLVYLNMRNLILFSSYRWMWIPFLIIGIIGLVFSFFVIFLLVGFRHGIGF